MDLVHKIDLAVQPIVSYVYNMAILNDHLPPSFPSRDR